VRRSTSSLSRFTTSKFAPTYANNLSVTYTQNQSLNFSSERNYAKKGMRSHAVEYILDYIQKNEESKAQESEEPSIEESARRAGFTATQTIDKSTSQPVYKLTKQTADNAKVVVTIPTNQESFQDEEDVEKEEDENSDEPINFTVKVDNGRGILEWSCVVQDDAVRVDQLMFRASEKGEGAKAEFWDNNIIVSLEDEEVANQFKRLLLETIDVEEAVLADLTDTVISEFEKERDDKFVEGLKKFIG